MSPEQTYLTNEGFKSLEIELDHLRSVRRPHVAGQIQASKELGAMVENAEYEDAMNELAFLAVGIYGKSLPKQHGAPLRLVVPWKYGFKSIKSIVSIDFVEERPRTFWEIAQPREYGFWANVNPEFDHPRWSQKTERMLGTNQRRKTEIFNGYSEFVSHLYPRLKDRTYFF